ncbi:hypothetical protein [Lysobacter tyrosinilyticus]
MRYELAIYLADAIAADTSIGVELGTPCALIIALRHSVGDELDFDRALACAQESGWAEIEISEGAFVSDEARPDPGFEAQLQETYQGALDHGHHIFFAYDRH